MVVWNRTSTDEGVEGAEGSVSSPSLAKIPPSR